MDAGAASAPRWKKGSGEGRVTAEYATLPRATNTRNDRESVRGKTGGRTQEISRLIGRSLRAIIGVKALGENTIVADCDVLDADGGTRTAAIKPGAAALSGSISAVSVGITDGVPMLDLPYEEDVRAETDMNVVMSGAGNFVEVQGAAERAAFSKAELDVLLELAAGGNAELARMQAAEPGL